MFERKLSYNLGEKSKALLREFANKKRMTIKQYYDTVDKYNSEVEKRQKEKKTIQKQSAKRISELPAYVESNQEELKQKRKSEMDKIKKEREFYKKNITKKNINEFEKEEVNGMDYLHSQLKKYIGKNVIVKYIIDGKIIKETTELVGNNFSSWWKKYSRNWWKNSEITIFQDNDYKGKLLIYPENVLLEPKKVLQYFKEGITNCLYTPIINVATKRMEEAKSKSCKYRYKGLIEECEKLQKQQLKSGVPEDFLPELANRLQIDIKIRFPLINKYIEVKSVKKSVMSFVFTNTRLNHVELNEITYDNNFIEISKENLYYMIQDLNDENAYYEYTKNADGINSIQTINGNYRIKNELRDAIAEFENEFNLHQYKIDDIGDKDLSNFIRNGTHYNETIDFTDIDKIEEVDVKHYDMKQAYANFFTCKFYSGFLGKITDFRETDKIIQTGFYYIYDLDFSGANEKFVKYNDKLKIYFEGVYPSPELEMLTFYGVTYKIKCGCWGVESANFRFPEYMLNSTDEFGSKYYAKCVGIWDSHNTTKQFWYKGCNDHFDIIRSNNTEANIKVFGNECALYIDKEHNYHLGHFTGFITSYQRMNVIEQLMEMDYDKLIRVCVDGIYTYEDNVKICNVFRPKPDYNFNNTASEYYISSNFLPFECGSVRKHFDKELFLGAGGCGKTHNNLIDKGLVRPLYIAPSWKLARNKQQEYGINVSVWDRLYNEDPNKTNYIKRFSNVLIVDEVSMMTENQKERIFELYPECKIIFCGDLGHQLPPIEGEPMSTSGFDNEYVYGINRRCKCDKLKVILDTLRSFNEQHRDSNFIRMWIKSKLQLYKKEDVIKMYDINDMILVGTHKQKDEYTALFKGKFSKEKYLIKMNTRLYNNGEIIISDKKPEGCGAVEQHAFTIHSIQGETAKNKLFIDLNKIFDTTMIYTAISRASYLEQIYIFV